MELFQLFVLTLGAVLNAWYAQSLGRSPFLWTAMYFLLPPFLTFPLLMLWGKTDELKSKEYNERNRNSVERIERPDEESGR